MISDTKLLDMLDIYLGEITSVDPNMNSARIGEMFGAYLWEYSTGDIRKDIQNMIDGVDYTNKIGKSE